ncbi:DNA replication/repair protein RecF [Leucobacter sp. GX24907]
MRVTHLSLLDFRNYRTVELPLEPGANLIVGRNGQGKTNLVEAIAYFSSLRSHRVSGDSALIRAGASAAIARLGVRAEERTVRLELQINRSGQNRAQINGNTARSRELMRWFSSVTFAPEDLTIVRGEPSVRRRFLDDALVARSPAAAGVLSDYERVVRQRTSLLKSARANGAGSGVEATLSVWDEQLIEYGTRIMEARRQLIIDMAQPVREAYGRLVGEDHSPAMSVNETLLTALERGNVPRETLEQLRSPDVSRETLADFYRQALWGVRQQELERAVTLIGPHRDDLGMELNGLPVKGYASHGESWSYALALRLSLASILRDESLAGDPVIILDDVFAELDAGRRARLMHALSDFEQVIVTAAVEGDVPDTVDWSRTVIRAGEIVPATETSVRDGDEAGEHDRSVPDSSEVSDVSEGRDERAPRQMPSDPSHEEEVPDEGAEQ